MPVQAICLRNIKSFFKVSSSEGVGPRLASTLGKTLRFLRHESTFDLRLTAK